MSIFGHKIILCTMYVWYMVVCFIWCELDYVIIRSPIGVYVHNVFCRLVCFCACHVKFMLALLHFYYEYRAEKEKRNSSDTFQYSYIYAHKAIWFNFSDSFCVCLSPNAIGDVMARMPFLFMGFLLFSLNKITFSSKCFLRLFIKLYIRLLKRKKKHRMQPKNTYNFWSNCEYAFNAPLCSA